MATKKQHNITSEKDAKNQEDKDVKKREMELADISAILNTQDGIRFFKRLMEEGMIFRTTYTGNSNGYFNEGRRSLVLKFFDDICEACPEKIPVLIMKEKE